MTAEQLAAICGVILSLLFSYVPGASDWFNTQPPTSKRLIMAALLLLVSIATLLLSCAGVIASIECTQQGAIGLVSIFIAALVANQAAFLVSPQKAA